MKNCITFCEVQTAIHLKEIIQPLPPPSFTTSLEQKFSYGDMQKYTDICFQVLQEWSSWVSRNGTASFLKIFFPTPNRNIFAFAGELVKWKKVFGYIAGAYHFQCHWDWGEVHEMSFFERNCIVKWMISFCWLWDFLLDNLEAEF